MKPSKPSVRELVSFHINLAKFIVKCVPVPTITFIE